MTTPRRPTFPVPVRPIPLHSSSPSDHHHPPTSYKHPSSPSITSITAMLSARPMQPLPIAAPQSPALLSPNVPASPARPSPQSQHSYSQQPIPPSIQLQAPSPQPTPDPTPTVSAFQQAQQIPHTPQSSEQVSDCLIYTQRSCTHVLRPSRFLPMSRHGHFRRDSASCTGSIPQQTPIKGFAQCSPRKAFALARKDNVPKLSRPRERIFSGQHALR